MRSSVTHNPEDTYRARLSIEHCSRVMSFGNPKRGSETQSAGAVVRRANGPERGSVRGGSDGRTALDLKAWNNAFALEAFFTELSRHASALAGDERAGLEARIQTARELA